MECIELQSNIQLKEKSDRVFRLEDLSTKVCWGVWHAGSCSLLMKRDGWWWWLWWKIVFCIWEFALSNSVTVLFVAVVVAMEINKRCYFWCNLCIHNSRQFFITQCSPGKPKDWTFVNQGTEWAARCAHQATVHNLPAVLANRRECSCLEAS